MDKNEKDLVKFLKSRGIGSGLFYDYKYKYLKDMYIEPTVIEERNISRAVRFAKE